MKKVKLRKKVPGSKVIGKGKLTKKKPIKRKNNQGTRFKRYA